MFDWIVNLTLAGGYLAILWLMLLENVFPPIPSELIMPLAGYLAGQGFFDPWWALAAGSFGSLLGATVWYWAGWWIGCDRLKALAARHGRWLTLTPREVEKSVRWFRRHGELAVLLGRCVPAVRTLISVPAGVADMRLPRFLGYTAVGTVLWTGLLTAAGYALGAKFHTLGGWISPIGNAVLALGLGVYVYRVVTTRTSAA